MPTSNAHIKGCCFRGRKECLQFNLSLLIHRLPIEPFDKYLLPLSTMKFPSSIILALLPLVLANPIAEAPASADGPAAIPFGQVDGLMRRESCSVTGKGGLNVLHPIICSPLPHC